MFNNPELLSLIQRLDSKSHVGGAGFTNPTRINSIQLGGDILSMLQRQVSNQGGGGVIGPTDRLGSIYHPFRLPSQKQGGFISASPVRTPKATQ